MTQTVTLTQSDWAVVTAALLCLHDHDDARGADLCAVEAHTVRQSVIKQLGWSAGGTRTLDLSTLRTPDPDQIADEESQRYTDTHEGNPQGGRYF